MPVGVRLPTTGSPPDSAKGRPTLGVVIVVVVVVVVVVPSQDPKQRKEKKKQSFPQKDRYLVYLMKTSLLHNSDTAKLS